MVDSMMLLQEEILRRLYWLLDHPDERGWSRTLVQKLSTDEDQFRTEYLQLAAEELVYPPARIAVSWVSVERSRQRASGRLKHGR
jgi:hypothetical protein